MRLKFKDLRHFTCMVEVIFGHIGDCEREKFHDLKAREKI